jgi:hypothetical protein
VSLAVPIAFLVFFAIMVAFGVAARVSVWRSRRRIDRGGLVDLTGVRPVKDAREQRLCPYDWFAEGDEVAWDDKPRDAA